MWSLLASLALADDALPAPGDLPPHVEMPAPISEEEVETIVIIADPFVRWDGTRWYIKTEVGLPWAWRFFAEENWEFSTVGFQVRTILACDKDEQLSKRKYEVHCVVEDFAIQATDARDMKTKLEIAAADDKKARREAAGKPPIGESKLTQQEHAQAILEEIDKTLSGASLQLQVSSLGRVTNIDLEGVDQSSPRSLAMFEVLSKVLSRVIVGFDMRLENHDFLEEGFWTEYSSALMSIPQPNDTGMGNSVLIHRLATLDENLICESRGKGLLSVGGYAFTTSFAGVAVYDSHDAYMTERVWVLKGLPTAGMGNKMTYWHAGRIVQLDPDQKPSVGPTRLVHLPCCPADGIAAWTPLEE